MYQGKVDLHLHLDGSLSLPFAQKYLEKYHMEVPADLASALSVTSVCENLRDYLNTFRIPKQILQYADTLEECAYDLVSRLADQGLIYAEIRFAPMYHCDMGLTQSEVVDCVLKGFRRAEQDHPTIKVGLLLCMMVGGSHNEETLATCLRYIGNGVSGLDLAGAEGSVPLTTYSGLFAKAKANGIPFTIHAGECGNHENIMTAVSYGATRIGHGVAAMKSQRCMELLQEKNITVECCFTSNLQTKAVLDPREHPIYNFYQRGLAVTVNTDNMTVSDTSLAKEHQELQKLFPFTDADFLEMDRNAIRGAFLPKWKKTFLLDQLEKM
jgi:adenosine deaminase